MNLIHQMLFYSRYIHVLTLSLFFTILVAPNKQFFNPEFLRRTKTLLSSNCIPVLYPENFMLGRMQCVMV